MRYLVLLSLVISFNSFGQRILLMHNVEQDSNTVDGPGKRNYNAQLMGFGFHIPIESNEAEIQLGKSYYLETGTRSKLGVSRFFEIGLDQKFAFHSFFIANEGLYTNDTISIEKERLNLFSYQLSPFFRFHFTKRGDSHGKYLDLAPYGEAIFMSRLNQWIPETNDFSRIVKTSYRGPDFINPWNYGVSARLGTNVFQVFGNYRLSSYYKADNDFPELPRLTFGFMMDIAN